MTRPVPGADLLHGVRDTRGGIVLLKRPRKAPGRNRIGSALDLHLALRSAWRRSIGSHSG